MTETKMLCPLCLTEQTQVLIQAHPYHRHWMLTEWECQGCGYVWETEEDAD